MGKRQEIFSPAPVDMLKPIAPCEIPTSVPLLSLPTFPVGCSHRDLIRESASLSVLLEAHAAAHKSFASVLSSKVQDLEYANPTGSSRKTLVGDPESLNFEPLGGGWDSETLDVSTFITGAGDDFWLDGVSNSADGNHLRPNGGAKNTKIFPPEST
jgi:hypothetical protein